MSKLCLNMIVKNESKVIRRMLQSVHTLIDEYCICDTGSTDNTKEIIETYFQEKGIPGKVIEEPFRDFGYNRTYALDACREMNVDYILLMDADMVLWKESTFNISKFKQSLTEADYFYLFQGDDHFHYKNTRIVRNNAGFSYWGVTHEYLKAPDERKCLNIERDHLFIKDIGDGGAKSDKFSRDIRLLRKGLEEDPENDRYHFYLANSLKDNGQPEEAIQMYKKRIELDGWIDEVWYSYYCLGKCYKQIGQMEKAICTWMEAYDKYPNRVENLYEIIEHYRYEGKSTLAYLIYELAQDSLKKYPERDHLFMHKDIYEYKLDYEFTIFGFYHNPKKRDLPKVCMKVLSYPHIDEGIAQNILNNYKFYAESLIHSETLGKSDNSLIQQLKDIGKSLKIPSTQFPHFVSSTPSICLHPKNQKALLVLQRYVNYYINEEGGYEQQEHIETKNVLSTVQLNNKTKKWNIETEHFVQYDTVHDNLYLGLEDMRIMSHNHELYYTANRGLDYGHMVIEHGQLDILRGNCKQESFLTIENQRDIEKNWVMFTNAKNEMHIVYNWYPMTIGTVGTPATVQDADTGKERMESVFSTVKKNETPYFFKYVRGSCNGMVINDEIWFLCHIVSYEDRRYYYHLFVVLDNYHLTVKKYTRLFTFEKEKVEYCLGCVRGKITNNEILFGYSIMDRETKFVTMDKSWFDERMIEVSNNI